MILTAGTIMDRLVRGSKEKDPLVITPPPVIDTNQQRGSASIDLRLGTWFVALRQARMTHLQIDKGSAEAKLTKMHYVRFGDEYYLHPRCFVLGVTLEWLRMPRGLAAYVIGKSSWGRRGLIIATATGVHPGFTGCLTLELTNVGEIPIAIRPGMPICQLFFHSVAETDFDVDQSRFVGSRKPSLGSTVQDDFAQKLADAV